MKITKFGHCCMCIEERGLRILTDPGVFAREEDMPSDIDIILITHEHADHFHVPSVKAVMAKNPGAKIYTIASVGELLEKEGIAYSIAEHGREIVEKEVIIRACGQKHARVHSSLPQSDNTGFFIGERLFYPGDAFTDPGKRPEILALPVAGPWLKLSEAVDYALLLKPDVCFPVHDGIVVEWLRTILHKVPTMLLEPQGIRFTPIDGMGEVEL